FKVGDTVRMLIRQSNNDSKRVQNFSGLVIKRQGSGISSTFPFFPLLRAWADADVLHRLPTTHGKISRLRSSAMCSSVIIFPSVASTSRPRPSPSPSPSRLSPRPSSRFMSSPMLK
ncbi:MAG: 50S ribosomal protein L19, partial [Sweet potato little leaf phytoplasma]|nr:50S ribosomal protein L19 [Sweet potato little leaf phytoplasma]